MYGSLFSQIEQAVQAAGGQLIPLPTTIEIKGKDMRTVKREDMPCIANFPNQQSYDKFLNSVKDIIDKLELSVSVVRADGTLDATFIVPVKL